MLGDMIFLCNAHQHSQPVINHDIIHMFVCCLAIAGGVAAIVYAVNQSRKNKDHNS
jgi:uncharacterized membrane protein HdeD (DUF308 family)